MATERVIQAILRLAFDKKAVADGIAGIKQTKAELDRLGKEAADLQKSITLALSHGQDAKKLQRDLAQVEQAMVEVRRAAQEGLSKALFEQTKAQLERLNEYADRLEGASTRIGAIGGGVGLGFFALAQKYADSAGRAEQTSRDWLAATNDLARAQQSLGRSAAQALLPVMETAADLMRGVAGFAERNPAAIKAALGLAGGAAALGGLGALLSQGIKLYTDVKFLAAAVLQNKAAQTMLQAAGIQAGAANKGLLGGLGGKLAGGAALAGSAVLGGAALGVGANEAFAGSRVGTGGLGQIYNQNAAFLADLLPGGRLLGLGDRVRSSGLGTNLGFESLGKYASVGAYGAGSVFGDETAKGWFEAVAKWTGQIADNADKAKQALTAGEEYLNKDAALDAFIAYQQEQQNAEKQYRANRMAAIKNSMEAMDQESGRYEDSRLQAVESFEAQRAEAEADFQRQRERDLAGFLKNEGRVLADYERSRAKVIQGAAAEAGKEQGAYRKNIQSYLESSREVEAKAEQSYYDRRKQMLQQYNREVQRAEADHQRSMRRMQEDHQRTLEDAVMAGDVLGFVQAQRDYEVQRRRSEQDYRTETGRRSEDAGRTLDELEADFRAEKEARQAEREKRLAEMQAEYEEQQAERRRQTEVRLAEMQEEFERQKEERATDFAERQAEQQADYDLRRQKETEQHEVEMLEMDEAHRAELERLRQAKTDQLAEIDRAYNDEKSKRERAFADQLRALDAHYLGEREKAKDYYEKMEDDFEDWLENMRGKIGSNQPGYPGRAAGGYVGSGLYQMGERGREFVLSNATTQAMERSLGSLSQDRILGSLGGGSNRYSNLNYNPQYTFNDRDDSRLIMAQIEQQLDRKLMQLERGF
jgi:hypothetical protein